MFSFTLFAISGLVLIVLMLGKRMAEKKKKPVFILKLIMKGDERARDIRHKAVHLYSVIKDRGYFIVTKQLPMQARITLNKLRANIEERAEDYFGNIRDSRLIKKQEGISEFFEKMSEVEKGNGEINDIYEEAWSENKPIEEIEKLEEVVEVAEETVVSKPKKRAPRRKKIVVQEVIE